MNLTKHKLLGILMALTLVASACGSSDDSTSGENETDDATETVDEETVDEDEVEEDPAEETDEEMTDEPVEEEPAEEDPAPADGGAIGFSYGLDDAPIYQNVLAPALARADELGFTIVEGAAASNCEAQLTDIDNMVASAVDALVVLNLCPGGYDAQIQSAQAAGIPFVTYLWDHPDASGRILLADEIPGQMMSDALIDFYENEYEGAPEDFSWILHGCSFAPPNIQLRTEIPKEAVTAATGVEPFETDCALAPQPALDATLEILQADPGIDAVLGLVDGASLGSFAAFEQADGFDRSNVFIAGVDGELEAVELVADSGGADGMYRLTAALDLEAVGFAVVDVAIAAIEGDADGALFSTRHIALASDEPDQAGEWFDRVFGAYSN